jgi:O-antigen/teichoic acid export membrane protein
VVVVALGVSSDTLRAALILLPVAALAPVLGACTGALRATFRPGWLLVSTLAGAALWVLLAAIVLGFGSRTSLAVAGARAATIVAPIAILGMVVAAWRRRVPEPSRLAVPWRRLASLGFAMLLTAVFAALIAQLDTLVLGIERGASTVALYQPLARIAGVVVTLPGLIGTFFLPTLARDASRGRHREVGSLFHWASRWSLVMCAPALGLMLASPVATATLVFGHGFEHASAPLRVLALGALVQVAFGLNGLTLDAYGLARPVAIRLAMVIPVSLIACVVLIPIWGAMGAASATAIALLVANVLCSAQLHSRFAIPPWDRRQVITMLAFAAGVGVSLVLSTRVHRSLEQCVVTACTVGVATAAAALASGGRSERAAIRARLRAVVARQPVG